MTLQEQLRLCLGRDRLDDDDQVALVPRWTVKESADELDRLEEAMASAQACCDAYAEENQRFSDECVRLQAENEALRADAERYRWLRNSAFRGDWMNDEDGTLLWDCDLDAAIDAAMKEKKP